ncbi:MAG: hypothetical protein FWE64_03470 [Alphaproteobacteria bacterium]|nr:hypothetical protein [Alphaproteobacteria bacterium]
MKRFLSAIPLILLAACGDNSADIDFQSSVINVTGTIRQDRATIYLSRNSDTPFFTGYDGEPQDPAEAAVNDIGAEPVRIEMKRDTECRCWVAPDRIIWSGIIPDTDAKVYFIADYSPCRRGLDAFYIAAGYESIQIQNTSFVPFRLPKSDD